LAHPLRRLTTIALTVGALALSQNESPKLKPFSHKAHLKLGNIAPVIAAAIDKGTYLSPPGDLRSRLNTTNPCLACHHGIEDSGGKIASNFLSMADCLVCHNKVDPPDSCAFCHLAGSKLRPANHTADFLEAHSRTNANLDMKTCAVCHGRKFTCMGCHLG
jgi:hypothetical protein